PCRMPHPGMIGQRTRHQQPDIHATPCRPPQGFAKAARRYEVSAHDPGALVRVPDAACHGGGQLGAIPRLAENYATPCAFAGHGLSCWGREGEWRPARMPRLRECTMPVGEYGTVYLGHEIAPRPAGWPDYTELVGEADASDERHLAIDEHELAMIPQEVA